MVGRGGKNDEVQHFLHSQPCKNILSVYSLTLANKFTPALFYFLFDYKTKKNTQTHMF